MKFILILITIITLGLLFIACKNKAKEKKMSSTSGTEVSFIDICRGQAATNPPIGKYGYQLFVFQTQTGWAQHKVYFHEFSHTTPEKTAMLDTVDFNGQILLIFSVGATSGVGYAIDVDRITSSDSGTRFYLTTENPPPDAPDVEVMTHPVHIVLVDKTNVAEPFEFFVDRQKTDVEITYFNAE